MYWLMLAFLLANGGLIYVALYASSTFTIGVASYIMAGLVMITLWSQIPIAKLLRRVGAAAALLGVVSTLAFSVRDSFMFLRGLVLGSPYSGSHLWWEDFPQHWVDAWVTFGVLVQFALLVCLALAVLIAVNDALLKREQPRQTTAPRRVA